MAYFDNAATTYPKPECVYQYMSFKCFSLAMSIISIKSFVEENRIIKKQNAILKKLQEVFGQVGILLK